MYEWASECVCVCVCARVRVGSQWDPKFLTYCVKTYDSKI